MTSFARAHLDALCVAESYGAHRGNRSEFKPQFEVPARNLKLKFELHTLVSRISGRFRL